MASVSTTTLLPDITRPDCGLIVVAGVVVDRAEDQRRAADVVLDAWDLVPWPQGLLSHTVFLGTDGRSVLHYSQWRSPEAFSNFERTDPPHRVEHIARSAPALQRRLPVHYELYRTARNDESTVAGCIVIVDVEFDGPDSRRQREWVDAVFDALEGDRLRGDLPEGGLGAYFHASTDGTRVLNYAEWVDEAAHVAAMERGGDSIGRSERWERVQRFPGLKASTVSRYRPYRRRTLGENLTGEVP